MKIPEHCISDRVRKKAFAEWMEKFRRTRYLFEKKEIDIYQLFDMANDESCDQYEECRFLLEFMSALDMHKIGPDEIGTTTHPNGVVEMTIDGVPLKYIYKTQFEKTCTRCIIERNLSRGADRE